MGVQLSRLGAVLCVLVLLVLFPLQAEAVLHGCTNEPTGSTLLTDWAFNSLSGSGWGDAGGNHRIGTDGTAPISPSNVYQQIFYNGMPGGISPANDFFSFTPVSEVYKCFYWKANAGFQQHPSNRTKIIFLSTTNTNPLFFYMGGPQGTSYQISMQYQNSDICNDHISGFPGVCGTFDIPGSQSFTVGNWVKIELYVKRSTTTTSQNGILRFWVNGVLAREYTNMNFELYDFASVPIVPVWGGTGGTKTQEDIFSYDHIVISAPNCASPCGGGSSDTTPPSQVTGVNLSMNGATASLTWAASSDDVGVTNYLVEKCTPHGCTNWALDQTVSGLSASISGLTAGVSYDFRVRARDAAGNLGAYSATVTGTTTSEVERTLATDTFNRANGALGANWTGSYSGSPDLTIVSNAVRGTSTAGDNLETYTAISSPADQWAQVDVTTATGAGLYAGGVVVRTAASPVASFYMCRMQANGWAGSMIEKLVNGSYTLLASSAAATWASGDKLKCTARGSAITLLRVRGGVESVMLTANDSTHATGRTGVITYADTIANLGFDNFTTGDWAMAAAAPTITAFTPDATGANVTWTGSPAFIHVQTYTASGIFSDVVEPIASFPAGRYTHTWEQGITSGCVFAQDADHVENTTPSAYRCNSITPAPPADTTPPVRSSLLPTGVLVLGTTSTTLSLVTNEVATCKWNNTDVAYASMANTFSTTNGLSHSATKSGLSNGTSYTVYVRCSDVAGNLNPSSSTISFSVDSAPAVDSTAPSTVTGLSCISLSTTQIQCAWTAATDNVAVDSYRLYACMGVGCSDYALVASPASTSATVSGLTAATVYGLVVDAIDTSGNVSASHSTAAVLSTMENSDIVPPSTLMDLHQSAAATYTTASLAWEAGTDNVGISRTLIERCAGVGCTNFQTLRSVTGAALSDTSVKFGTTYRYRGKHLDTSGNISTNYSDILTVVIPNPPVGVTIGACPCKTH